LVFGGEISQLWLESLPQQNQPGAAHSDDPIKRIAGRMTEAKTWQDRNNTQQALLLVEEYTSPTPENLQWPFVLGYIQAAKLSAESGQTYDAVRRLGTARDKSEGLGKIAALRALSVIVEEQPDLEKALAFEKRALSTGKSWFKRKRISETAGLEPAKEGSEIWEKLKPIIEARIVDLERRVEIDRFGLDYVMYREAQILRRAGHPAALDFTDIAAAFRMKNERFASPVPGADFEAAREHYLEIIRLFPEGVYAEAAQLYAAVCLAHLEDVRGAIRELSAFYQRDPDGLYRGHALLLLGDLYLTAQWDRVNAKEAYTRASAWAATVGERQRILETYAVPEKSAKVSKPPVVPRSINQYFQIEKKELEPGMLVNRITADWVLPTLRREAEWKLGFLAVVDGETESARKHFDQALALDRLMQRAVGRRAYNVYSRLQIGIKNGFFIGEEVEMKQIDGKVRLAMHWADFNFMMENFELAQSLYRRIERAAREEKDPAALVRATVGEISVRQAVEDPDVGYETPRLFLMVMEHPEAPASPWLLWECACITRGDPMQYPELYNLIIEKYPDSRHALEVRYNQVIKLAWKYHEERRVMIEQFKRDYPDKPRYHLYLEKWDKGVKRYMKERDERWAR
jgi:tetratricopeptide (TPR) repeat protein